VCVSRGHTWDGSVEMSETETAAMEPSSAQSKASGVRVQYVRFEQVPVVATHQGNPFNFSEVKLMLDRAVYTAFKGSWRSLFKRLTRHVVISVLKSIAGLQVSALSGLHLREYGWRVHVYEL